MVTNRGAFTIMAVEVRFCTGNIMYEHQRYLRVSASTEVRPELRGTFKVSAEVLLRRVLTPLDIGIRFETDAIHGVGDWYPMVRWNDRWGTRWENKRGVVRPVSADAPWEP